MSASDVGTIFDAGAREFALWSARLWDPIGLATVRESAPVSGERVLDACCGSGASALPAARAVAPNGGVVGVDLSTALLEQGRARARDAGVDNLRFEAADVCEWPEPESFDLVQVVHGVAFFGDMDAGASALIRALRPGGRLAVTVWADGALGSFLTALSDAVAIETGEPKPIPGYSQARERIADANLLRAWLERLGLERVRVRRFEHTIPIDPVTAWEFVLGNAARGLVEKLDGSTRDRVRERLGTLMRERGLDRLDASSHIAVGEVPR
ncbi:methyltransferase domain-containing protein [Spiractinospora alimapuensis]|uniref:class I SAM-dependent methyltransferase n=1 Tax=Spiractinospora alimapuensis TaxID=2820884 RepID=UPI001F44029A|nr:methyltransferase domain-containing protein [Spiractinospora alimapuensis]QVQ53427.1 methyltransferase domain-containing protein [Spiractinospora alimapuensis]